MADFAHCLLWGGLQPKNNIPMSSTPSNLPSESSLPAPQSYFGWLWQRWQHQRLRNRKRQLGHVRFRLTREGYHFLFVLSFIFIGAVIREINLLILLAGTMIGLLLLQWRFSKQILFRLKCKRRQPLRTRAGEPVEVVLELSNPRRWLGAWMILIEDNLQRIRPTLRRVPEKGVAVIQSVPPSGTATARYELKFMSRGLYRIGPTTLSTRFPIGLGRSWRVIDSQVHLVVHPALGKLLPACRTLLQGEREGNAKAAARASVHEGEFYGLRDWQTGDSRRWVHWRTTAKRGELSVRQFEQLQRRQMSIALDLYGSKGKSSESVKQHVEAAIAFAASLATEFVARDRDKLAFAIAGEQVHVAANVQSSVLVQDLLDHLAEVQASPTPDIAAAISQLSLSLSRYPTLMVISTRENQMSSIRQALAGSLSERILDRLQIRWIDVSSGELDRYFEWEWNGQ